MLLNEWLSSFEKGNPMLILSHEKGPERIIVFSTNMSEHKARMIMLPESIVVEHTVGCVETATYAPEEAREAIEFIESLFYLY